MRSGKLQKKASSGSNFVTLYFICGLIIFLFITIIFTDNFLKRVRKEVQAVPNLYSKFLETPDNMNLEHVIFQYFMEEIMTKINFPMIIADSTGTLKSWENISVDNISFQELDLKSQKKLKRLANKMASRGTVITMRHSSNSDQIIGYVYYGDSQIMASLKRMPYYVTIIVGIFIILGIYGIIIIKKGERDIIWVSLAKETAHQFGTPLSSLGGWINVLHSKMGNRKDGKELQEMLDFMRGDVERLSKIASRFGKVGSVMKFQSCSLHDIIQETIDHFERRLPTVSNKIEIKFESEIKDKKINLDPDLIKWTLENMLKNCIDSMKQKGGNIGVKAFSHKNKTYIHIADEGNGMPKKMFKKIFRPGVTNKERGWGLGLSLAHRIVEEYHNGKIRVLESEVDVGTTFEIVLPEAT